MVSFGGSGISASSFAARVNFVTGADPAYVALGDLNGDGKIDVATPNNASITNTSIFRNLSTGPGSLSFTTKTDITNGSNPIAAFIGDIDGDGLPDLVVANTGSASYSIFRNTSTSGTISFAAKVDITGAGTNPYDVTIGDIDGDGKADLVVANYAANGISVYRNTGVVGTIAFAAKVDYSTVDSPTSVSLNDLDGDGKLDIAVAGFLNTNTASLFRNTSTPGTVSLASRIALTTGVEPRSVASGDLDGDGKPDLAVANGGSNTMSIFRNTSTVGALSFDTKVDVATGTAPFSVAIGDIDGDTKVDLAVANFSAGTVSVFKNNSASGSISLAGKLDFTAGIQPRSVFIADQDGDGKNDLTTANFGSDNFSVFRNTIPSPQSITFGVLPAKTFGDASFTVSATASSGLSVSFGSDNTAVANVVGTTVQIVGAGTCNIIASQAGNSSFSPAPNVSQALVVSKANQAITFGALAARNVGDLPFSLTASSNSGLTISYSSSNPSVATVSGNSVTIVGVGSTTITASQAGNANYNPATNVQQTLTVNKGNQTISFGAIATKTFGDAPFVLAGTASSGLPITYNSTNTSVASISGSTVTILASGTAIITATQLGNLNYNAAANVQQTITVNKANQTITFGALPSKTVGDPDFTLSAVASSGLPVTFSTSPSINNVVVISGNTVFILGAGSVDIIATQPGDGSFNPAPDVTQVLTVKDNQTITFNALPTKTFGNAAFNISATATSGLGVSFSSSNTAVATILGNTVTVVGVGTTSITASQAGNTIFNPAANVSQTLTVNKANQTITFNALPVKIFGDVPFAIAATTSSTLPVTFASSNTSVATVSGNTVTIIGGGTATITATQIGNTNYNSATPVDQVLTVNKTNQTITFGSLTPRNSGDSFLLTGTASSGLPVSYTSSNTAVAVISGSTVNVVSAGTATITASQSGNASYNAATNVQQTLTVNKGNQAITFNSLADKTFGEAAFDLLATASSSLAVSFSSSNASVATISGSTVTIIGAGSTTITASQAGDANYNAAASVAQTLTVNKANQIITFAPLPSKSVGDPSFALGATASSGLAVSYGSNNASVATVSGNTVTIIGAGTAVITASQLGNADYNSAGDVTQSLLVKSNQTITFGAITDKTVGDAAFALSATTSSNLPVTFSTASNKITISGTQVTIVSAGRASIMAAQAGNTNFNAATSVERSFCIKPTKPTVTLSTTNPLSPTLTSSATAGNQWFRNGTAIAGATNPTYSITQAGIYKVQVQVDDCISAFSDDQSLIVTAVEPTVADQVSIYPNPAAEELSIDLGGLEKSRAVLVSTFDLVGRSMNQLTGEGGGKLKMDVRSFNAGRYIVLIKQGNNIVTKSFVKK